MKVKQLLEEMNARELRIFAIAVLKGVIIKNALETAKSYYEHRTNQQITIDYH